MKKYSIIVLLLFLIGITTGCFEQKTYFKELSTQDFYGVSVSACGEFTTNNSFLVNLLRSYVENIEEGTCLTDGTGSYDAGASCSFDSVPAAYLPPNTTLDIPFTIYFSNTTTANTSVLEELDQTCTSNGGTFDTGN